MKIVGKTIKYGNDVNTDVIYPGRYLAITDSQEMSRHAMEDMDPKFAKKLNQGKNIIVAGSNFGCGSSREQAATCLKYAGIRAIVARSFARIFYRNAINQGIPIVECDCEKIMEGDELKIDIERGSIEDLTINVKFAFEPLPNFLIDIITAGGLIENLKKKLR
jgi:3-isopropylmalate/(R)-2-methylmalate dehydratase small subunit